MCVLCGRWGGQRSTLVFIFNKLHQSACPVTTRPLALELQMCPAIVAFTRVLGNPLKSPFWCSKCFTNQPTSLAPEK